MAGGYGDTCNESRECPNRVDEGDRSANDGLVAHRPVG